jgi:hypothetical protein
MLKCTIETQNVCKGMEMRTICEESVKRLKRDLDEKADVTYLHQCLITKVIYCILLCIDIIIFASSIGLSCCPVYKSGK